MKAQMSQSLHVCKICGKKFATPKAVYGHQRIHSGMQRIGGLKEPRVCLISTSANETYIGSEILDLLRRGYKPVSSLSLKESSSFMTETEQYEMNEAAMSLITFSERVAVTRNLTPGDIAMDLELKSMQEKKIIHCAESKQESHQVLSHLGLEKSTTCSDVVSQALPSPLRIKSQKKPQSNFSYKCKICGKTFGRSQVLGGHQTLHRSIQGQLACRKKDFDGGNSLSVLNDSRAKKVVPKQSCFDVSLEELTELRDSNVEKQCVESKQDFSEVSYHSGFENSSTCSDVVIAQALPFPLRSKLQKKPESQSSYRSKTCGKSFACSQVLGGHQTLTQIN